MKVDLDHVKYWIDAIRDSGDPKRTMEAFWSGQLNSKEWLIDQLGNIVKKEPVTVDVYGGWVGLLPSLLFQSGVQATSIRSIDIDPTCESVANSMNWLEKERGQFTAVTGDMVNIESTANVVINTSCEHITSEQYNLWLKNIPRNSLVVIQSNNYKIDEHIRTVESLEEFKRQCYLDIVYAGQLELPLYKRFMIIGYNTQIDRVLETIELRAKLKLKISTHSTHKVIERTKYLPVLPDDVDSLRYSEWEGDSNGEGIFDIGPNEVFYYNDRGRIDIVSNIFNHNGPLDFEIMTRLYERSIGEENCPVRFSVPIESTVDADRYIFSSYRSPSASLGVPFIYECFMANGDVSEGYLIQFIDQVSWIINAISEMNYKYPGFAISLYRNRFKDEKGHYFHSISYFNAEYSDFIETQLKVFESGIGLISNINHKNILEYAKSKWTR